jgi:hypothetical protein
MASGNCPLYPAKVEYFVSGKEVFPSCAIAAWFFALLGRGFGVLVGGFHGRHK